MIDEIEQKGFFVSQQLLDRNEVTDTNTLLQNALLSCAEEIGCELECYLSVVSRWAHPSPLTKQIPNQWIQTLTEAVEKIVGESVVLKKVNIICKNAHCTGEVPFHQDIAYSPRNPYQFTTWIALNDVVEESGALSVIPGSHLDVIQPAVDFWSPRYRPNHQLEEKAVQLSLKAGEAVFFDSRLWHGSFANSALKPRYALVMRWASRSWYPPLDIPTNKPLFFGMWSCGQETRDLLSRGLLDINGEKVDDFTTLLEKWTSLLGECKPPFECHVAKAIEALKHLKVLHLASEMHNGGDATGTVYKNLWNHLLEPLATGLNYELPI